MSKRNELHQVIVKSLSTHKSVQETFDFFSNPKNMELGGAIHSMQKNSDDWYTFDHIIAGKCKMKHTVNQEFKILDHVFQGAGLEWNVYVRVLPNGNGSTITWTFIKPDGLSNEQFKEQLKSFDSEIEAWRRALERKQ
jgi:protein-tyrosine-phosphatase